MGVEEVNAHGFPTWTGTVVNGPSNTNKTMMMMSWKSNNENSE
jgi:hypothetical protein